MLEYSNSTQSLTVSESVPCAELHNVITMMMHCSMNASAAPWTNTIKQPCVQTRVRNTSGSCVYGQASPTTGYEARTSHCFALKNVDGPTGGPSSGGIMILLRPPTCMPLRPTSKPATQDSHSRHNQPCIALWLTGEMQSKRRCTSSPEKSKSSQSHGRTL